MIRTIEAAIDEAGNIRLLEPVQLPGIRRAFVMSLDDSPSSELHDTAILSESALADACDSDRDKGIEAFLARNDGEVRLLPEILRRADYGRGHDAREAAPARREPPWSAVLRSRPRRARERSRVHDPVLTHRKPTSPLRAFGMSRPRSAQRR